MQGLLKNNKVLFKHARNLLRGLHCLHAAHLADGKFLSMNDRCSVEQTPKILITRIIISSSLWITVYLSHVSP